MAITVSTQVIEDGPRNYVVLLSGEISGGEQELFVNKIDVSTLTALPGGNAPTRLALEGFQGSTIGIPVRLYWAGTPNKLIWGFPANFSETNKFRCAGPIKNDATSYTGDVLLSTDPAEADGSYSLTLFFKKKYA
jgi:hypothetical protein